MLLTTLLLGLPMDISMVITVVIKTLTGMVRLSGTNGQCNLCHIFNWNMTKAFDPAVYRGGGLMTRRQQ